MSDNTRIDYLDATWNPVIGCSKASPGCRSCYAERMSRRIACMGDKPINQAYRRVVDQRGWTGRIALVESTLEKPLQWKRPRVIGVGFMGDLFHENVPIEYIVRVWEIMAVADWHTYIILTKRAERMCKATRKVGYGFIDTLPNVIGMVSVENQAAADVRVPWLLKSNFAHRGLSVEPMLGPVDIEPYLTSCVGCGNAKSTAMGMEHPGSGNDLCRACGKPADESSSIDWVICGGESGPGARPMHPNWVRSLRDQCREAGVPFFFKQWGAWVSHCQVGDSRFTSELLMSKKYRHITIREGRVPMDHLFCVGKRKAGHLLDGEEIREVPEFI